MSTDRNPDESDYEIVDVQADPDEHREAVKTCLTDHLDEGHVPSVVSMGTDPRTILATCHKCRMKWWFEEVPAAAIPGTPEAEEAGLFD